jgi:hypothetical protein
MAEVDSLEIGLQANAKKANDSIETLITKLGILASALGSVNSSQLGTLAMNVNNLGASMKSINDVGTASFTRLAKNITKIASVDSSALNTVASSLNSTASAFNQFTAVSENAAQIGEVAKNISKLGNKSVQTSITNMPQLATSLTNLLTTLASAPTVSNNVIQMTNALANLASQGSRVGSASRTIQRSLNGVQRSAQTATKSTWSLAKAFGKFYASYFMVVRGIKGLWTSIESTTDYIEAFNYYAVAFGKIGSEWGKDFEKFGYDNATDYANSFSDRVSALLGKLSGLQVDVEGGLLTADGAKNLGLNIQEVTEFASQLASVTNSLGQTGETTTAVAKSMTMLAGDISSLFNVDYSSVATNLQSGLIGQSRALYKYGIDITNATLATYAYNLGVEKSISEMTQMEKQQLRVLAILDQSKVSWGDLSNTISSPSNMIRQFNTNIKETSMVLGQLFIPVLQKVMPVVNGTTIAIKRMLVGVASLMGVKIDFDAFGQNGYKDTTDGLEDMANGYDDVAKATDKAQKGVRGFDELENRTTGTSKSGASTGTGDTIDLTDEIVKATEEYEKVWNDAFDKMENKAEAWADKVQGFFERMFKPLKTWGGKVDWKKLKNGFNGILDFAKKFTVGTGTGFLDFIEGLSNIGAPAINLLGGAVEILFKALNLVPAPVWHTLGGALGGVATALLAFKAYSAIASGINTGLGKFADAILKISSAKPVSVGEGVGKLGTAIASLSTGGYVVLAVGALAAVAGAIISVEQAYDNMVDKFVDASVFDNQGTAISNIAQSVIELIDSTGTSSEDMTNFATELERVNTNLQNASEEVDNLKFRFDNLGLENVTDNDIENMKTAVGNLASALRDDLQVNSDMAWQALQNMSSQTAEQLGIDVGTMTTILSQFNAKFNGIYTDMETQANVIFDKILSGTATQADVDALNSLLDDMNYLSEAAIKRQVELENTVSDMMNINFGSVEETTKAIADITEAGQTKLNEVDEYYKSLMDRANEWKISTERALEIGRITPEEASTYLDWISQYKEAQSANWDEEKNNITSQISTTFDYIQSQVEKAGVEAFQNAQTKDWGIAELFKNPIQDVAKSFDKNTFKPISDALSKGMEALNIEPSKDNHLYQRWLENATLSENDVSGWAMRTANTLGNAILANSDITTKAFAEMAGYDVSGYTDAIKKYQPNVKTSLINMNNNAIMGLSNEANTKMQNVGKSVVTGYIGGVNSNSQQLIKPVAGLANLSLSTFMEAQGSQGNKPSSGFSGIGKNSISGYIQGIDSLEKVSTDKVSSMAAKLSTTFADKATVNMPSIGVQVMTGFLNGLTSMEQSVYSKADEIAKNVAKTIQSALDIHSPSRVMFELGAYTTEGFKEGMESLYKPTELSIKDFGFGMVEAVHPQQLYSGYADYTPSVSTSTSTTTQNYYNTNSSVDNAETNALLRELISAVKQGSKIEIDGKAIGNVVRKEDRSYFQRTGRGLFEH